jgi:hypothetical protein
MAKLRYVMEITTESEDFEVMGAFIVEAFRGYFQEALGQCSHTFGASTVSITPAEEVPLHTSELSKEQVEILHTALDLVNFWGLDCDNCVTDRNLVLMALVKFLDSLGVNRVYLSTDKN